MLSYFVTPSVVLAVRHRASCNGRMSVLLPLPLSGRGDVTAKSTSVVSGAMLNELILSNNRLVGCLPTEIGLLGSATVFDASWNSLMGMLPTSFAGLSKADQLDLSHNVLTGVVPKKLCELPSLDNFTFSYNYFTGADDSCVPSSRSNVLFEGGGKCLEKTPGQRPAKRCLPVASRPVDCSREKSGSSPSSHPPNPTRKPVTPSSPAPSPKTVTPSPVPRPVHSSPPPPTSPPPASVFPPPPPDFDILPPEEVFALTESSMILCFRAQGSRVIMR
ncbi:hypothetical protein B296_00053829, partial [Ensete ventricosum]